MKHWKLSDWMRVCVIALAVLALALTLYALYRPGPESASFQETDADTEWIGITLGRLDAPEFESGRV